MNYNLSTNSGQLLLNYEIKKNFGLATGIEFNELSGNGTNILGNFYHERTMLKIPLLATLNYKIDEKLRFLASFGIYGQTIISDKYQFINSSQSNLYAGWNYGFQINTGFVFKLNNHFSTGVNFSAQSDFSKLSTKNNNILNDKQKLKNLNAVGLLVLIDF